VPAESVLAIDAGTQTARAALVGPDGSVHDLATSRVRLSTPRPGWAEQDPEQWWAATASNITAVMSRNPGTRVSAVAVCGQMHGVVALDAAGKPLTRQVGIWSDKRAAPQVAKFRARADAGRLSAIAANVALPAWAGFKMAWIRSEQPDLYERAATFLVTKDFLNLRLCGEIATDPSEASGTFLADAATGQWAPELVRALGLDDALLPPIVSPTTVIGGVRSEVAAATGLRAGTPVVAGGGDMLCQLLAVGLTRPGRLAEVAGTGSIVAAYGEDASTDPRVMSLRTLTGGWANFGIADGAGSSLGWLDGLLSSGAAGEVDGVPHDYAPIDAVAAAAPPGSGGLLFFPYLLGERTMGSECSRASFVGLTLLHEKAHMARAIMEGVCFENRRALDLLVPPGEGTVLRCTGGGSHSSLWNQIRADIYERPVRSLGPAEGGLQGAALLAAVGAGWYADAADAAETLAGLRADWQPRPEASETYRANYAAFCAVHDILGPRWDRWCE
jgi:sugar (pentulose or hexulose) kinase